MTARTVRTAKLLASAGRTTVGAALLLTGLGSIAMAQNTAPTPEIDAGSAVSALAFLSGSIMLLRDRFRAK